MGEGARLLACWLRRTPVGSSRRRVRRIDAGGGGRAPPPFADLLVFCDNLARQVGA